MVLGGVVGGEEAFECLVESFDFSLGLWGCGASVLLRDAVSVEEFFESSLCSFEAGQACDEDQGIVGEGGLWWPVCADEGPYGVNDHGAGEGRAAWMSKR